MQQFQSIRDILNESLRRYSQQPAFLQKAEKGGEYQVLTFERLMSDVNALGARLLDLGLEGKRVAVIGANCYQWIVAYLAVLNGVGVIVPLDRELKKADVLNLISQAECQAVFYTEDYEEMFQDADIPWRFRMNHYTASENPPQAVTLTRLIAEGAALPEDRRQAYREIPIDPERLTLLMFTSGTTSFSKGVMLCHRNLAANVQDIGGVIHATPDDRTLSILPNHHCFESILGTMFILSRGASIAFGEGLKYVLKNTAEAQVTILLAVPLLLGSLYSRTWKLAEKKGRTAKLQRRIRLNHRLKALGLDLSKRFFRPEHEELGGHIRLIFTGAAAIDPKICRGFEDLGIKVLQGYGLTEGTALVSGTPESEDTYTKSGSVGPVVRSISVRIEDPDGDGIGRVVIKGPTIMMGYYNMPEETARIIRDGWMDTGDLGFLDPAGWLYIVGRSKNVIVTETGKNVFPEELEAVFLRNRYIHEILIYGAENQKSGRTLVSAQIRPDYEAISADHGPGLDEDAIYEIIRSTVADLNQEFPHYKQVRSITIRKEEFVKTTTKKIKRRQNVGQSAPR